MPKKYGALPKLPKQTQPNKAFGPGAFGPIVAPKASVNAPFGSIVGGKQRLPKLPKLRKQLKSYL